MSEGIISAIDGKKITVVVRCQSACVQCAQRHACSLGAGEKKIIVTVANTQSYKIGQEVKLTINKSSMVLSLLFAYGIPLLLLLFMVGLGTIEQWSETKTGLLALSILIPYYIFLFMSRSYLKRYFTITIAENPVD